MPLLYKKIKTKSSTTAKALKVTSGIVIGAGAGIKDNVPENAVRGVAVGAGTALIVFYIVPPVGIPISGAIVGSGAVLGGAAGGIYGAIWGAITGGKEAIQKFDDKQERQRLDLEDEKKHEINDENIKSKIEWKNNHCRLSRI